MKQILVMMAAVVLVGCGGGSPEYSVVEFQIRSEPHGLDKWEGELTKSDFAKITLLSLPNHATDVDLREVPKLQNLDELHLPGTQITDVGLKEVAKLRNLTALDLSNTQITDAGLKDVAKLQKLKYLQLNNTQVTDAGVVELKKALPNCGILGP